MPDLPPPPYYAVTIPVGQPTRRLRVHMVVWNTTVNPVTEQTPRPNPQGLVVVLKTRPDDLPNIVGAEAEANLITLTLNDAARAGDSQVVRVLATYQQQNITGEITVTVGPDSPPDPAAVLKGMVFSNDV